MKLYGAYDSARLLNIHVSWPLTLIFLGILRKPHFADIYSILSLKLFFTE